ncbi:hypothetical protein NLU13_8337 [Sarocladium strictum]|uniref:DUF7371 domain-containing protein n=1 Tax=Sarocladium strictum TaxID=5046 RepID=A0AA39GCY1_SARSR|nr:hypothetical protein NLU13_8337 [Sarocladium strictum]
MRAPKPLGVLVAGSFFALARAQATAYGSPDESGQPGQDGNPNGWQPPNGNGAPLPSGNPGDWQNQNPLPLPSGSPRDWQSPGGNSNPSSSDSSGNWPDANGAAPSASNSGTWPNNGSPSDSGNPGDWPNDRDCLIQGTTTVFVTVLSSSPAVSSPSGVSPPDGSNPDGSVDGAPPTDGSNGAGPDSSSAPGDIPSGGAPPYDSSDGNPSDDSSPNGSSPQNPGSSAPGNTGPDSPQGQSTVDGGQVSNGPVKPFTTLTIDIWGTGDSPATAASGSSPQATSDDSGVITDAPEPAPSKPSDGSSDQPNSDPGTGPEPYPSGGIGSAPNDPAGNGPPPNVSGSPDLEDSTYGNPEESPVFVSDGKPAPSAVSQSPANQPQITSLAGASGPAGDNQDGNSPYSVTIIGPDGQPTIVSHPWGHGSQPGEQPIPTNAYASDADALTLPNPASAGVTLAPPAVTNGGASGSLDPDDSGVITCVTIVGNDGKPTVIDFTAATASPTVETAVPDGSALSPSITIIGADGKPTVVSSPWFKPSAPGDSSAPTGAPGSVGSGNANGNGGAVTSSAQLSDGATTCVTVLGSDGKPTVVDWPWAEPGSSKFPDPVPTIAPLPGGSGGGGNGNGGVLTDGSALPQSGSMTQTSFTVLGPDGLPTVVETTWAVSPTEAGSGPGQGPIVSQVSISGLPSGISAQLPIPSGDVPDGSSGSIAETTTCFTIIGPDGQPTVIEATLAAPEATGGPVVGPGATLLPPSASGALPISLPPVPNTASQAIPGDGAGGSPGDTPHTTCTSYTVLGTDGLPTVVETTWVVPPTFQASSALATHVPGPISAPGGQSSGSPGLPDSNGAGVITTCSTYTVIGPDGVPSAIETTFLIPAQASGALATDSHLTSGIQGAPWSAASGNPAPPSAGVIDPAASGGSSDDGAITTCITVLTTGADGTLTPVEQTVILPPASGLSLPTAFTGQSALPISTTGFPGSSPTESVVPNGDAGAGDAGGSNISGYGGGDPSNGDAGTIAPPAGPIPSGPLADPVTAGSFTSGPVGLPLSEYGAGLSGVQPLPATIQNPNDGSGVEPSESTLFPVGSVAYGNANAAGVPVTSTWSNEVPAGTTTHLLKFPLTTLATLPAKRALKRQVSVPPWGNSSTIAPTQTSSHTEVIPAPSMCAKGGNIGNRTVNFDNEKPGPLFNPSNDLWFSEGFLIAPPSSQEEQSYFASSGGQLVEFVPASLTPTGDVEGSDVAEVGVGPNASKGCYRFDLFGASLGCAAEGAEGWCEFEISAYRWSPETSREESIAWSETKRVPACANFPHGSCALTPVDLAGYTNITGVLITLRVGLDLRAWWGDDFRYGWTDNSCEAATCRGSVAAHRVKRETVEMALRRGVWHWTPEGVERLDDDFIWDAVQ